MNIIHIPDSIRLKRHRFEPRFPPRFGVRLRNLGGLVDGLPVIAEASISDSLVRCSLGSGPRFVNTTAHQTSCTGERVSPRGQLTPMG